MKELFNTLITCTKPQNLFREHMDIMKKHWNFEFVRNLAQSDYCISTFLEGYWRTSDYRYYLNFYENNDGGTSASYSLPSVAKPSGTKFYYIEDMVYYWADNSLNKLAKVFKFFIVHYDTIKVTCYQNYSTYTLYRQK